MIEIKPVRHKDCQEVLINLFRTSFRREMSEQLWNWKYINHPLALSEPEVIVAMDKGKIVGARPFLLMELQYKGERLIGAEHCDTMVHPEYRNKGIFNKMGTYSIRYLKEHHCAVTYGFPNAQSRQGFLNQGYRIVAPTEILFRPLKPQRLISQKTHSRWIGHAVGSAYEVLSKLKFVRNHRTNVIRTVVRETCEEKFPLLNTWQDREKIDLVRSKTNLKWRFDHHPHHTYRYILAEKEGTFSGYAVISVQEQNDGQKRGIIMDYLIQDHDPECFRAVLKKASCELARAGADIVVIWAPCESALRNELIEILGFKSSCKFPYNKLMESGHIDALLIDERIGRHIDFYEKLNWRMTCALADFL